MAFVYLIAAGRDTIKVGKADDVGKRMRALQTGQPFSLRLVHKIEVLDGEVLKLEKVIHKRLKRHALRGEWFRVEPKEAIRVADRCAAVLSRLNARLERSEKALIDHPGTVMRHIYCPTCFHRGSANVPLGTYPAFKCSQCGEKEPLIGGIDPIRPWWKALKERAAAAQTRR